MWRRWTWSAAVCRSPARSRRCFIPSTGRAADCLAVCPMVKALWAFFLLGLALFFFYDVLRFWRSVWGSGRATFLADVLWWLVAAFSCYTLFFAYTGHLWARLGKRLAGKRNNRRKKRKILQEKAKKLLQSPYNILYNKLNARKRKRKRKRHLAATAAPEQRSVEYDSKFEELHEAE